MITVSELLEYFETDWGAMTVHDWIGFIITVVVLLLMIGLYIYVFHPKNKQRLEKQRHIPMEEDGFDSEEKQ